MLAPFLGHLIIQQHFHLSLALFTLAGATDLVITETHASIKTVVGTVVVQPGATGL